MKVLFLTHYAGMYGANKSLLQLLIELRDNHRVIPCVVVAERGEFCERLSCEGITHMYLPFYTWQHPEHKENNKFVYYFKSCVQRMINAAAIIALLVILRVWKISLIHSNSSVVNLGAWLHILTGIPHFWHLREFGHEDYHLKYAYPACIVSSFYHKGATTCIAISKAIKTHYENAYKLDNVELVYNGIRPPASEFDSSCEECTAFLNFVVIGALRPEKGQLLAIEALARVSERASQTKPRLFIIGDGEAEYSAYLTERVRELQLEDMVQFLGYIEDINSVLPQMHVGLMCSSAEAFGRVTVECMMQGLPVIASDAGANRELITEGETGLFFRKGDQDDLAKQMAFYIDNPSMRIQNGRKAQRKANDFFSSENNSRRIYCIYKTVSDQQD